MKLEIAVIFLAVCVCSALYAQQPCELPFASSSNILELTVANTSSIATSSVKVLAANFPSWITFSQAQHQFNLLKSGEEQTAVFVFSVDKSAPVNSPQTLSFVITNAAGESWAKEISISVAPPMEFELFQNYPNPFNPATTISYQMPEDGNVSLRIYDILGREIAALVDEFRPAGFHEERWDATRFASGMYVYQLILTDRQNKRQVLRRTMMLVK